MTFIENIKTFIGRFLLKRELKHHKRKHSFTRFSRVDSIGIVYNAEKTEEENMVNDFANKLRLEGKKVFLMGFVNLKFLPHSKKFLFQNEYFWREKLDRFNLPVKGKIGQFLHSDFDFLLNLYLEPSLPMQAIAGYSAAKYRVGANMEGGLDFCDALIDVGKNKNLNFLIQQIDFYLRNVK
ncbi:MAG: DUF6913 domain-containing protein [Bacteroidia bacterium]